MKPKIYIDGKEGTTGLQIFMSVWRPRRYRAVAHRRGQAQGHRERRKFLNAADIAFLCLPDAAAREAVSLIENNTTRVIDASTAHRTDPDWRLRLCRALPMAHRGAPRRSSAKP